MMRFFATILTVVAAAGFAGAADEKKVTIRWHGQSFYEIISSAGTRIVVDPHAIEQFGRIEVEADLILVSHPHSDHLQLAVVANANKARQLMGVKTDGKKTEWNKIDEQFKDFHIRTVGLYHDDVQGMQRGKNSAFIIEVDGIRIVHLGDLGHLLNQTDIRKIGQVDVLMIPVGGVYTINGSEAKKVVEQLKPRQYILPMHYGGIAHFDVLLTLEEFLDEQKKEDVKRYQTNELIVDSSFKPERPVIALLNWTKK
jgi:L-ascorbate metabolism protein UlaG (beta-lactamase superfamily)